MISKGIPIMSNQTASCCQPNGNCKTEKAATPEVATETKVFVPQVDIVESEDRILLVADLPGVDQEGIEVTLEKNVLTLRGAVKPQAPEGYSLGYSEYSVGNFERAFTVSNDIDRQAIEAVIKDGVLKLTLPKAKHAVTQKITVKTA
jgi:HSP20 family protein